MHTARTILAATMGDHDPNPFELKLIVALLTETARVHALNEDWIAAQQGGATLEVLPDGHARVVREQGKGGCRAQ